MNGDRYNFDWLNFRYNKYVKEDEYRTVVFLLTRINVCISHRNLNLAELYHRKREKEIVPISLHVGSMRSISQRK